MNIDINVELALWKRWAETFADEAMILVAVHGSNSGTASLVIEELKEYKKFLDERGIYNEIGRILNE